MSLNMRLTWSRLTPFEKTAAVVSAIELAIFIAVVAVPTALAGYSHMLYWLVLGPPSLCIAPLLFRWFKYQDERAITQPPRSGNATSKARPSGEA